MILILHIYIQKIYLKQINLILPSKIIELLIHSYIYTYPHIFNYSPLKDNTSLLSIYKYINNSPISFYYTNNQISNTVYIEDTE